jgi:PLP dependent protein
MALDESQIAARLRDNIALVRERIEAASKRAGREEPPRMMGVTKYVEPQIARLLVEAGVAELGESRPQELWRKAGALADLPGETIITWHLIGHLQRNKVKRTLPLVACIDSADSLRLMEEISREAVAQGLRANMLLEVNMSGEASKQGLAPGEVEPLLPKIAELPGLSVLGLMTMAPLEGGPDGARRAFAGLRELRDRVGLGYAPNIALNELSMGMSGDYEIAAEEGATIVRVGSALFEGIGPSAR